MGTKAYSLNSHSISHADAVKLGFAEDVLYVIPAIVVGDDESTPYDKSLTFVQGNDCKYLDILKPNIHDIGLEHNVYHEKCTIIPRIIKDNQYYLEQFDGYYRSPDTSTQKNTIHTWHWTMNTVQCFYWEHVRYEHRSTGICNYWNIRVEEPVYQNNILRYGKITYLYRKTFTHGAYDGESAQSLLEDHPELFTTTVNNSRWKDIGYLDVLIPKRIELPNKDDHPLTGDIESACALEALNGLKANTNNIANLLTIIELAKGLLHPSKLPSLLKEIPKKSVRSLAADTWLQYRYVYKTTISDVEEMTRFINQALDHSNTITLRGGMSTSSGTCRVRINAKLRQLNQFAFLQKYGLAPDLYNLWDMIPYSFIVDWFVGIGDLAEQISNQQWAMNFDIVSCTISWKWHDQVQTELGPMPFTHYQRFVSSKAPEFVPYCSDTVSDSTIIKRILDGAALLLGK